MSFAFTNWFPTLFLGTWKADTINGTERADIIITFGKNDTINAGGGNDLILSGAGNDVISAGNGNDIVEAGSGDDVIDGGLGSDTIVGGAGFDIAVFSGAVSDYSITLPGRWNPVATVKDTINGGTDLLTSVEALYFKADDYTLYLDGRNNPVLARDDAFSVDENAALTVATSTLTANDKDFDGDKISVASVSASSEAGATVTLANGTVTYDQGTLFDHLGTGESTVDTFTYTVDDGRGGSDTATVSVTIEGVNDAPEITSAAAASIEENTTATVLAVAANDVDGDEITYSILGGADASLFAIDAKTGELKFANAPDFENPADQGGDNVYDVTVGTSDGKGGEATQDVTVTVTDADETPASTPRINEIHYDNDGADAGEFVEIRVEHDADVSGMSVELYNGSGGAKYASTDLSTLTMTSDGDFDYYVWDFAGIQNGSPDGLALSNNGSVIEFLSYEGSFTATGGAANGLTSTDIGVSEAANTPAGQSLQRTGDAPTAWTGPEAATKGTANDGGTDPGDPTELLISEVQGTGTASQHEGDYVLISAVVTYTLENGFYLQEEATDSDGNTLTSEGIFVFTGGAPSVAAGDLVKAAGTVDEFFGLTEITDLVSLDVVSSGNDLPDYSDVTLPLATSEALEQFEGMRISLTSGTDDAITVTENFSLDRFGEIAVSAGNKYQPTQVLDPTTDAAEIAALTEANALNRLVIDDGVSAQNPTEYKYIPVSVGDNGNGYLDSGDTFSPEGPTLRLGAELDAPVKGVLSYGFDAYRMFIDGQLSIDESTNSGAREDSPADVGGTLKVSSFNLLNFFTTLNDGSGAGSGPNNLEPRGATTAGDLERQLDKIVASMLEIDADVFGLQELENNGFTSASAINTLVNALNSALGAEVYAFVDPTGGSADGFIGTDAITTGVIYKQTSLTVVGSDYLEFDSTFDGQQLHRPAIAVAFEEISSGERFTVAVNHLKSKGDSGLTDVNNPNYDQGDGQSFWNAARAEAAGQLAAWLATDPTGSGDSDALIIGDLNSYAQEDPVDVLRDAGFIDLIDQFIGQENAYSYVFDGQRGTLDQGLSTASLLAQITGVTEWHINSDEPGLLSYSSEFKDPDFYSPDPFATSDHDPLIIGIDLGNNPAIA
ncbi:ExeM/NucH family extracellular endonuclease [Mesorhizobium sp. IMUNJ 23232]|uniref:ExeM/NucH family extracellular endonuclease n=1 Tax=Mesorhizobium sp. IMUNJ 23232 TaxID=3376064 RepID=UPI0037B02FD4